MLQPCSAKQGQWGEGGRRKGSLKDPVFPCISGPFVLFPFTFLPSCYISNRKQNKKQSVFEREWQDLENLKLDACTSLFAGLLGPFAHRLLEPGELAPYWNASNGVPIAVRQLSPSAHGKSGPRGAHPQNPSTHTGHPGEQGCLPSQLGGRDWSWAGPGLRAGFQPMTPALSWSPLPQEVSCREAGG